MRRIFSSAVGTASKRKPSQNSGSPEPHLQEGPEDGRKAASVPDAHPSRSRHTHSQVRPVTKGTQRSSQLPGKRREGRDACVPTGWARTVVGTETSRCLGGPNREAFPDPVQKQGLLSALRRVASVQKSEFIRIRNSISHGAPHTVVPLKTRPVVPHTKTAELG